MRYSATTGGFYPENRNYQNLPNDLVTITDESHALLIEAQGQGKIIQPDAQGYPQAVDPPAMSLQDKRDRAWLTRTAFCQRLWRLGVLPKPEAVQAARGEWPATFAAYTSSLTDDEATDVQIEWAASSNVVYANPSLQALALANAGGDQAAATALLDQIFEIA